MPWQKPIGIESDFTFAAAAADWIFKSLYDRGYWSVGRSILSRFSIPFQYMAGSNGFFFMTMRVQFHLLSRTNNSSSSSRRSPNVY